MSSALARSILRSTVLLGLFSLLCAGLVAFTYESTRDEIAASEKAATVKALNSILDPASYDNDPYVDAIEVTDQRYLGSRKPQTVYRARMGNTPVAAVISCIATRGYSGPIKLLVAVRMDGSIAGVRILEQHETPGLGDAIDQRKSDWLEGFRDKRLGLDRDQWRVRKDGGVFDQFTGATISPRAVVEGIRLALEYFQAHAQTLFVKPAKIRAQEDI